MGRNHSKVRVKVPDEFSGTFLNANDYNNLIDRDMRFLRKSKIKNVDRLLNAPKIPKYRNQKCEYNGIKFDSKKEMHRYMTLSLLEKQGVIKNLQLQVPFLLIPKNEHFRGAYYRADFTYIKDGILIVEDVKSPITRENPEYKLKKKLMYSVHHIKIEET